LATLRQQYIQRLNDIAARYGKMEDETARRIVVLLNEARREIAAEMVGADDLRGAQLRNLERNLRRIIDDFQQQANDAVGAAYVQAFNLGERSATEPLQIMGVPIDPTNLAPSQSQLNVILDFSAELVQNITDDLRRNINTQIRNAALGVVSPHQAMLNLSKSLGSTKVSTGVTARAERIVRTELQRTLNLATHAKQQANAEFIPGMLKRWLATGDARTRTSHLRIHNETRINPIPIDEPFILRTPGKPPAKLMYPLDPSGPPYETINCRCTQATIHPAIGLIGSPLDGRIAAELERR
jgi:hypothetical protein